MTAHFFDKDKPHGLVKRIMLKKFLQGFIASTLHTRRRALFIDGFAGAGVYGDEWPEEIEMFGSPIIALRVAFEHFEKFPSKGDNSKPKIYLYFVENKLKNFKKLQKNLKRALRECCPNESDYVEKEKAGEYYTFKCKTTRPIFCKAVKCDFKSFEPPTEMTYRNIKCVTFLDPFGVSDTPMKVVSKFSCAPNRSLIITFMSNAVVSFGHANRENVEKLYGIDSESLKQMLAEEYPRFDKQLDTLSLLMEFILGNWLQRISQPGITITEQKVEKCTVYYEKRLQSLTGSKHTVTFGMRREKENTLVYHIVFATNDLLCLTHMKEAMNRVTNYEHKLEMGNYDLVVDGVVFDLANIQDKNALADNIYRRFRGKRKVPIKQIKTYVTTRTPYVFRKEPLKIMMYESDPRIIEVVDVKGNFPKRRGTFPDHTDWCITFSKEWSGNPPIRRTHKRHRYKPYPVTHTPHYSRDIGSPSTSQDL